MAIVEPKLFRSGDFGAPVMNGNNGTLINVLDACLVTGYNSRSGLAIARVGDIATATFNSHGYTRDQVVELAGADQAEYNGQFRILSNTTNTFTFKVSESAVTPATGTITCKVAPLGWNKVFSGTNTAFYQSKNILSNKMFLKVLDDGTTYSSYGGRFASMRGYEESSDLNTAYAPFPRFDQANHYIYKQYYNWSVGTNVAWSLIGDDMIFYLFNNWWEESGRWYDSGSGSLSVFGDFVSYRPGDNYNTIQCSNYTSFSTYQYYDFACFYSQNTQGGYGPPYIARAYNQISQSQSALIRQNSVITGALGDTGTTFPNPIDGSMQFGEICVIESGNLLRGKMPGMYSPSHARPLYTPHTTSQQGSVLRNLGGQNADYWCLIFRCHGGSSTTGGCLMFDLTNPWRA